MELETADKINAIFTRFSEFMAAENASLPKVSNKVKCLIKNLLENRQSGWEKSKVVEAAGPMKV